jgi:hypothetical protein
MLVKSVVFFVVFFIEMPITHEGKYKKIEKAEDDWY